MCDRTKFKAIYKPTRTDDLRPELKSFIGQELEFSYAWTMDEDDSFPGEKAYTCHTKGFHYWVPERDIQKKD